MKRIEEYLLKKERIMDMLLISQRRIVRECSKAIKEIHEGKIADAEKRIKKAEGEFKKLPKNCFVYLHCLHIAQEIFESKVLLSSVKNGKLPEPEEPYEAFLTGALDAVGELKRQMYEMLRKGKKKQAEKYFKLMEEIYDKSLHFKFSESVLPGFRRKQDVARIQLEQARGELL
ncbi:MAG: hypothetical protein ACPL06_03945 [Candidatus Anstonellales archaeon]